MTMIEPMTAAEYRCAHREALAMWSDGFQARTLAALEERERLLGEVANLRWEEEQSQPDAALGALVRRIREHPMASKDAAIEAAPGTGCWFLDEDGLGNCLSHLDSLLPKEPEVVTGPSGREYRRHLSGNVQYRYPVPAGFSDWHDCQVSVMCEDVPVVAALMAGGGK